MLPARRPSGSPAPRGFSWCAENAGAWQGNISTIALATVTTRSKSKPFILSSSLISPDPALY